MSSILTFTCSYFHPDISIQNAEEPPQKITKIAIVPENDADLYEYFTQVKCYDCGGIEIEQTGNVRSV